MSVNYPLFKCHQTYISPYTITSTNAQSDLIDQSRKYWYPLADLRSTLKYVFKTLFQRCCPPIVNMEFARYSTYLIIETRILILFIYLTSLLRVVIFSHLDVNLGIDVICTTQLGAVILCN